MPSKPARRRHSAELKAKVLAACDEPGASVAAVALAHDLNANLVHKWRRRRAALALPAIGHDTPAPGFVAVSLPSSAPSPAKPTSSPAAPIRIAIERGSSRINVSWPVTAAAECGAWLREWLR
jgi:transposase